MRIFGALALVMAFSQTVAAQYPYASIVWYQPRSPTTNNVLMPETFTLYAAMYQGIRRWNHGFIDSTDYGRESMFWADLGPYFNPRIPWQVVYVTNEFLMEDPLTGELWVVYSDLTTLNHGPGAGGVSGRITWRYFH